MTAKHTPGPWFRTKTLIWALDEASKCTRFFALFRSGTARNLNHRALRDEMIANATLAHAAPDLLEALEEYVAQYGCNCGHPHCNDCARTRMGRAAITKAKEAA